MKRTAIVFATAFSSLGAMAQMTPVGTWHTIDDNTKEIKSEMVITELAGVLSGKVSKLLRKEAKQDAVCEECSDDRKGKLILGMEVIRAGKKVDGKDVWEGGKILDPESGKEYSFRMTPIDGGKKLELRAYIGTPMLGRTQTWLRIQ